MPLFSISPACVPFNGQDGRSYYMNEQGQLVRVNFKEAGSVSRWASLRAGQSRDWPDEELTAELRLALSKLGNQDQVSPASRQLHTSIFGHPGLSAVLKTLLAISGTPCETSDDPRQLLSQTGCLLVAAGYFRSDLFQQAEEAFLATGTSWVPLYLEGALVRFGPLMGPYLKLEDLKTRLLSANSSPEVLQDLWRHTEIMDYPGLPFSRPEQHWLGATLSLLLAEWHSGQSASRGFPPERYQLTLIPMTREIVYHPILRLPFPASAERMKSQ